MYNGVINIYKEPGYTSHDVVAKLRGITGQKKIGHTGTLDPDAEGVLCVCLGVATRVCDMLTDASKEYEARFLLGVTTDTQDMSGEILKRSEVNVTTDEVRECIEGFIGEIDQIPPMYSALKHNGKKLYELARAGIEVERKPRHITISDIRIMDIDLPHVTMRVDCSKGTYIRTLCHDIGLSLGCGAAMEHLLRVRVGGFEVKDSIRLSEAEELMKQDRLGEILIPVTRLFDNLETLRVTPSGKTRADNGNLLSAEDLSLHNYSPKPDEEFKIMGEDGFFYGIYRYIEREKAFKPVKMFLCK